MEATTRSLVEFLGRRKSYLHFVDFSLLFLHMRGESNSVDEKDMNVQWKNPPTIKVGPKERESEREK